jgi:hypothetical protein
MKKVLLLILLVGCSKSPIDGDIITENIYSSCLRSQSSGGGVGVTTGGELALTPSSSVCVESESVYVKKVYTVNRFEILEIRVRKTGSKDKLLKL